VPRPRPALPATWQNSSGSSSHADHISA